MSLCVKQTVNQCLPYTKAGRQACPLGLIYRPVVCVHACCHGNEGIVIV